MATGLVEHVALGIDEGWPTLCVDIAILIDPSVFADLGDDSLTEKVEKESHCLPLEVPRNIGMEVSVHQFIDNVAKLHKYNISL